MIVGTWRQYSMMFEEILGGWDGANPEIHCRQHQVSVAMHFEAMIEQVWS
jgi:hypothetical protein